MLEEFLNGRLAVFLDKENPKLIEEFYNLIRDKIECWSYPFCDSILDYLMSPSSGPYHFIIGKTIDGSGGMYAKKMGIKKCSCEEFIHEVKHPFEITENEQMYLFN